jgi:putative Mn2+ efflux pump MntP
MPRPSCEIYFTVTESSEREDMDAITITAVWTVLVGFGSGFAAAAIGYLKGTTVEKFDWKKFLPAVIYGGIVGAVMAWRGISFAEAWQFATSTGIIALVDMGLKLLWRRFGLHVLKFCRGE